MKKGSKGGFFGGVWVLGISGPTASAENEMIRCLGTKNDHHENHQIFEEQVLRKRPYLKQEWCERVVRNFIHKETQEDGRIRFGDQSQNWKESF